MLLLRGERAQPPFPALPRALLGLRQSGTLRDDHQGHQDRLHSSWKCNMKLRDGLRAQGRSHKLERVPAVRAMPLMGSEEPRLPVSSLTARSRP